MKKTLISILSLALTLTVLDAKPKTKEVVLDFSTGCTLTVTDALAQPRKASFKNPRTGIDPIKGGYTEVAEAIAAGCVETTNKKGDVYYSFPATAYTFTSNGETYPITVALGRVSEKYIKNLNLTPKKGLLLVTKPAFTIPAVEGYKVTGLQVYTVKNSKKANERFKFVIYQKNVKEPVAETNPAEAGADSVLSATIGDYDRELNLIASTNSTFRIQKIVFTYKKDKRSRK